MCILFENIFYFLENFLVTGRQDRCSAGCKGGYQPPEQLIAPHQSFAVQMTAPPSVTPQKYEPLAMDFWSVERMHASEASRKKGGFNH